MINRIAHRLAMMRLADGYTANGLYDRENLFTENSINNANKAIWNYISRNTEWHSALRKLTEAKLAKHNAEVGRDVKDDKWTPKYKPGFMVLKHLLAMDDNFVRDIISDLKHSPDFATQPIRLFAKLFRSQFNHMKQYFIDKHSDNGAVLSEKAIRDNLKALHPNDDVDDEFILAYDSEQEDEDMAKLRPQIQAWEKFKGQIWDYIAEQFRKDALDLLYNSMYVTYNTDNELEQAETDDYDNFDENRAKYQQYLKRNLQFSQVIPEGIWNYINEKLTFNPDTEYSWEELNTIKALRTDNQNQNGALDYLCELIIANNSVDITELAFALLGHIPPSSAQFNKLSKEIAPDEGDVDLQALLLQSGLRSTFKRCLRNALYQRLRDIKHNAQDFINDYNAHQKARKKLNEDDQNVDLDNDNGAGAEENETMRQLNFERERDKFENTLKSRLRGRQSIFNETANQSEITDFGI